MTKTRNPSVLFINRVYPPYRGATGRILRDLSQAFAAEGWDVTILTSGRKTYREKDGRVNVKRVRLPKNPRRAVSYLWVNFRLFLASIFMKRHDLVVTMTDPPMLVWLGWFLKKKWFLTSFKRSCHINWCHDLYPDILPSLGIKLPKAAMKYFEKVSRKRLRSCDKVVAIGRCMAHYLSDTGIDVRKIKVIPNWADLEVADAFWRENGGAGGEGAVKDGKTGGEIAGAFDESYEKGLEAGTSLGLFRDYSERFRVLYAGNIGKAHPMDTIIDAVRMLRDDYEVEFVFVGEGEYHLKLAEVRKREGLENMKFVPFQPADRLHALMESGDVHLVSMGDGCAAKMVPCKFYSSLAVGRPCIFVGPEDCEIAKVIREYNSGCVIKNGDADALVEAILNYKNNSDEWFAAHKGATKAGSRYIPYESISSWIDDARKVVRGGT